jgi:tetratricopeptide (TPR) repeat protein
MKKLITLFIFILIAYVDISAYSPKDEYNTANNEFNSGDYSKSAARYQTLIDSGYKESEVYFNLGNSYFRLNNIPMAILNFERAKKLNPNDDDIEFNLKIANLKIVDKFEPVPKVFFVEWYEIMIQLMYSGSWGILTVASCWVFFISIVLLLFAKLSGLRKSITLLAFISLLAIFVSGFLGYKAFMNENSDKQAIIFNPSVYVKSAPDPGSNDLFILHEGTKVTLTESIDNWLRIKLENGNIGWIKLDEIKII